VSAEKGSIKMKTRIIFLALFLATCLAVSVWAQEPQYPGVYGGFYGNIAYQSCLSNTLDIVMIQSAERGQVHLYHLRRSGHNFGFTTGSDTFIPGSYYLSVVLHGGTDCDHSLVQYVYHGHSNQEVNLVVKGPDGGIGK
jgi:hypothetical protein